MRARIVKRFSAIFLFAVILLYRAAFCPHFVCLIIYYVFSAPEFLRFRHSTRFFAAFPFCGCHFLRLFRFAVVLPFCEFLPFFLRFAIIGRFYCKSANRKSRFLSTVLLQEPFCRPYFFRRPKAYPKGLFRKVCLCLFQTKCRPLFLPYCIKNRCP